MIQSVILLSFLSFWLSTWPFQVTVTMRSGRRDECKCHGGFSISHWMGKPRSSSAHWGSGYWWMLPNTRFKTKALLPPTAKSTVCSHAVLLSFPRNHFARSYASSLGVSNGGLHPMMGEITSAPVLLRGWLSPLLWLHHLCPLLLPFSLPRGFIPSAPPIKHLSAHLCLRVYDRSRLTP